MDYFTKWDETMPTIKSNGETTPIFVFNQIIDHFRISKEIAIDHGSHFHNEIMTKLASKLGFKQDNLFPYYP
jgi:hypothetical protein